MGKKALTFDGKIVNYIKCDESVELICTRCKKRKISKKYGEYEDQGISKKLCNACYGYLLSKRK